MPYTFVEDFRGGLDTRRSIVAGVPGTLVALNNAHITRGGEIEKRKSFVSTYTLPAGTLDLAAAASSLYVFGHAADPGVPSGVTYHRLQHPDAGRTLSKVLDWDVFDGKMYAIGQFDDGSIHHFYDGARVVDWDEGVVRSGMSDTDGIAEHLKNLIDASDDYTATRSGSVITVTGVSEDDFAVETFAENVAGGTDDQTLTATVVRSAVAGAPEVLPTCTIQITGGTANVAAIGSWQITGGSAGAGNEITSIPVGSCDMLAGTPVPWNTSHAQTAADLAAALNARYNKPTGPGSGCGLPPPTGWIEEGQFYADGAYCYFKMTFAQGAGGNGGTSTPVVGGTVTVTTTAASGGVGPNNILGTSLQGSGGLKSSTIYWTSSDEVTAAKLADAINAANAGGDHDYTASVVTDTVTITAPVGTGSRDNGKSLTVSVQGSVTRSLTAMSGGVDAVSGQTKQVEITVGGTFEAGDRFGVRLGDVIFGQIAKPSPRGTVCLTHKNKMYSAAGSLLHFSGVDAPAGWNRDTTDPDADVGAGFINMASQSRGSETLTALGIYQGTMAVFARRNIQIWSMDTDPDLNAFIKALENTGTRSPQSVLSFGDNDTYYLDSSGIRSLRPRDSSGSAFTADVGSPIDPLVQGDLADLTDAEIEAAVSIIEPADDRYWLAAGSKVYVLSYFPDAKISAWSTYDLPGDHDGVVVVDDSVYVRVGNTIYLYGGADGATYDSSAVTVTLPYLTAGRPDTEKEIYAFGMAATNTWRVDILTDPRNTARSVRVGDIDGTTYPEGMKDGFNHRTTHFAPKLVCTAAGAATISNLVVHYQMNEAA